MHFCQGFLQHCGATICQKVISSDRFRTPVRSAYGLNLIRLADPLTEAEAEFLGKACVPEWRRVIEQTQAIWLLERLCI